LLELAWLFIEHGTPAIIRSTMAARFTATVVRDWLDRIGVLYIETGSPAENGYNESFDGRLRDELLNDWKSLARWPRPGI
jgi:putative transposase